MADPTRTPGYRAVTKTISRAIRLRQRSLYLSWYSSLTVLPPEISKLTWLDRLVVTKCPIKDLAPIAELQHLSELDITHTKVEDPQPLVNLLSLSDAAMRAAPSRYSAAGLQHDDTPLASKYPFSKLIDLPQPANTVETINYVRRQAGLQEYFPRGYKRPDNLANLEQLLALEPVAGVPSALGFELVTTKMRLTASAVDQPLFPFATSKRDHANRLATCQALAEDLANDLRRKTYNARGEYEQALGKYVDRLPRRPGQGNILLSEAAARTIRDMFAADADVLPVGLAAALKTLLEQHIGLRVYYPQIEQFYRDVKTGHMQAPLPLDAVKDVVQIVKAHTPQVFERNVGEGIAGSVDAASKTAPSEVLSDARRDPTQPRPPPDPLGTVDPQKARDYTVAGAVNGFWKVFLEGEKVHKAIEGWKNAGNALRPAIQPVLRWLRDFGSSGDGGPPMPPGVAV